MQISKELADTLLKESPTFRKFVLTRAMSKQSREDNDPLQPLKDLAIDAYAKAKFEPMRSPKIAAIKAVRENSNLFHDEIMTADPEALFTGEENVVSLLWAKEFVEKVCQCKV